jgi:hypothetical protein
MNDNYRFDYVFSYWIFAWFLFYYFKLTTYSPLFILLIGVIDNTFLYFNYINKKEIALRIEFLIVNFFIKILPIIIIIKSNNNIIKISDILATIILLLLYIIWLIINRKIIIENNRLIIKIQRTTPFYNLVKYYLYSFKINNNNNYFH